MNPPPPDSPDYPDRDRAQSLYKRYRSQYENTLLRMHRRVRGLLNRNGLNPTIKYRVKGFDSYYEKLLRLRDKGEAEPLVKDLIGMRIICPFLADLDQVEELLTERFNVFEVERKGLQHSFREFGYDSIHLILETPSLDDEGRIYGTASFCEVQLRTILQEAWAEIEHELIYKTDLAMPNESIRRKLASLNATLTLSDVIFQEIRDYQEEIRLRRERRKRTLEEKVREIDPLVVAHGNGGRVGADPEFFPTHLVQPKSQVEKLILEALTLHGGSRYQEAVRIYSQVLTLKADNRVRSLVYNHRGMAFFSLSEFKRALRDFSRAVDFDDRNHRAYYHRGLVWRLLKRPDRALEDLDRSLQINPQQAEACYGRAQVHFDLQNYVKALEDCDRALSLREGFDAARQFRAIVSRKMVG